MVGFKNYGTGVSQNPQSVASGGRFSADEKSFETIIIQADKPIIDWELNLQSGIDAVNYQHANNDESPSCWLSNDFFEIPNPSFGGSYVFLSPTVGNENKFQIKASNLLINGWHIRFEFSDISTSGLNQISLPAPPVSGSRTDLVILEVWRALVSPAPSLLNKSATGLIVRNGNVRAPDAANFADDLIDPNFSLESTKRVQIQYRYRVISGVNTSGFPDGIDDPTVFVNSVSDFSGPGVNGNPTILHYTPSTRDNGLWTAGAGDSASSITLGTVDGFMYAVPVCAIFRRNTTAFDRNTNLNGGTSIASGSSSRPDALFADQVSAFDIRDLRRGCVTDFNEVLEKAIQQVFDNTLSSNQETFSGVTGTSLFVKDDIGTNANFGNPDGIRRHFSDRTVTESIVVQLNIGGLPQSNAIFTLNNVKLPWNVVNTNLFLSAPSGINIVGVSQIRSVGASSDIDFIAAGFLKQIIYSTNISGVDKAEFIFSTPLTNQTLFVEIMIEYPFNHGSNRNMSSLISVWAPPPAFIAPWVDATQFTASSDPNRFIMASNQAYGESAHREIGIRLQSITQTKGFFTINSNQLMIGERLNGDPITINDGTNSPYTTTNYTVNTSYTLVTLSGPSSILVNTNVNVTYKSFRPAPIVGAAPADSYQIYYRSASIQSITPPAGTQTLNLIPRLVDQNMYIITTSTGSPDHSFPYFAPSEQLSVGKLPVPDFPEALLGGPAQISTLGFDVNTGFLRLPLTVPYSPNPAQVTLFRDALDTVQDAEGRNFWPKSQNPALNPQLYSPVMFGVQLSFPQDHKVTVPILMELKQDFPSIGRKGTLVLVMFTGWTFFSRENKIGLGSSSSDSAASVYRLTGNLLNSRRHNA